ncbi:hypothetical protein KV580_25525 [Pseudomonas chlororaphis]|nr:hypothetical protein [Pseudomonas chlororaphis]
MAESNVSAIAANVDLVLKLVPWAFGFIVLCVVWVRTGSLHYLVHRIFQTLGATRTFHSKKAQRQWDAYEDLQQHNLWHGLRLRTSKHMNVFQTWLDEKEVTVEEVSKARWYFDANKLEFDIPSLFRKIIVRSLIIGLAVFFALIAAMFNDYPKALLKVNKTDTWFWAVQGEATGFKGRVTGLGTWTLDTEKCMLDDPGPFEDVWDKQVVCYFIQGKKPGYLEQTIEEQKKVSTVLAFGVLFVVIGLCLFIRSELRARELAQRVGAS